MQKDGYILRVPHLTTYNKERRIPDGSVVTSYIEEYIVMRQDNRRVPTVMERLLLASVSLGLMMLASFVGSLYFTSGALPVKVALCTVLFVFLGMIIAVNVLFNKRR